MVTKKSKASVLSYFFVLLLLAGCSLFIYSFFTENQKDFFSGLQQIAAGIFLIGAGEWINHPLQKSVEYEENKDFNFQKVMHRKRNPSSLGNLLEISGLILIFTGLADYF